MCKRSLLSEQPLYVFKYSETLSNLERFELLTAATMKILFTVMQRS